MPAGQPVTYHRASPPEPRPAVDHRPNSRGAGFYQHPHHRPTSSLPQPGHGPPPHGQPELGREREEAARTPVPKRHREWEDEPNSAKSHHLEEKRPRLDESVTRLPSIQHDGNPSPPRPMGHDGPNRPEDHRRIDNYHPSEAAHHPHSLPPQSHPGPNHAQPKPQTTPPQVQGPPPPPPSFSQQVNEAPRPKESPPHEPPARKMDLDENYDDDGEDDKRPVVGAIPSRIESPRTERHDAPTSAVEAKVEA
jgi:general transcriptional corepressor CYC8